MTSKLANTGGLSMKDKKKYSLKIDQNGNVDTNNLSSEIKDSLEFDLRYKQIDNMKKRAIRMAGCYDDFKNMVACSHLKTVSRKEVESLREVKRGWQKQHMKANNVLNNPMEILNENKSNEIRNDKSGLVLIDGSLTSVRDGSFSKPKNAMEFERDWKRLSIVANMIRDEQTKDSDDNGGSFVDSGSILNEQRMLFLSKIGSKRVKLLLQNDISIDTLEGILDALIFKYRRQAAMSSSSEEDISRGVSRLHVDAPPETVFAAMEGAVIAPEVESTEKEKKFNITKWLAMIASFGDFRMLSSFLSKERRSAIAEVLLAEGKAGASAEDNEQVDKLIALYK